MHESGTAPAGAMSAREMFAHVTANVYSGFELEGIAADYRKAAERLVVAREGSIMLSASPRAALAAAIHAATSELLAYAGEIKQKVTVGGAWPAKPLQRHPG